MDTDGNVFAEDDGGQIVLRSHSLLQLEKTEVGLLEVDKVMLPLDGTGSSSINSKPEV